MLTPVSEAGCNWSFFFSPFLQDMKDMRDCYDSLLSAAAAAANSAYGINLLAMLFIFTVSFTKNVRSYMLQKGKIWYFVMGCMLFVKKEIYQFFDNNKHPMGNITSFTLCNRIKKWNPSPLYFSLYLKAFTWIAYLVASQKESHI